MDKTQKTTPQAPETERYEAPAVCDIEPVSIVTGQEETHSGDDQFDGM